MNKSLTDIIRDLQALQIAQRSGSPTRLRVTWRKLKNTRTLATLATRTDRNHQQQRHHHAPPVRRVANVLADLAKKSEAKVK